MCARGRRPAREPSAPRASLGASSRSPARPRRRPRAPQPGPAFCSSPVPSGPSGALHTSGAGSLMCGSAFRLEAWPGPAAAHGRRGQAPRFAARPCPPVPPAPSAPVGPGVLAYGLARRLEAWPGPAAPFGALRTGGARSLLSGSARVVTNVVNPSCFLCGFSCACYKRRQSDGIFAKNSGFWPQIDDVCNTGPHRGLQNAPV